MPAGRMYKAPVPVKVIPKKTPLKGTRKDSQQDKQIKRLEKKVNRVLYLEEVKYFDYAGAATAIPETGLLLNDMNFIQTGDTASSRDGNQIYATSLQIRAQIQTDQDIVVPQRVRMIVFWDNQSNGADASISGGVQSLMLASATVTGTYDFRNQITIDRYKILYDKTWTLNPQLKLTEAAGTVADNQPIAKNIEKYFKLGRVIDYSASTGAIVDLVKNTINVVFISDVGADQPTVTWNIRLLFKDV